MLVTLGLTPRYPATGFGYIETGEVMDPEPPAISQVAAFHEKPDLATAEQYLESGRHLWNSGMFAWRAEVLLDELKAAPAQAVPGPGRAGPRPGRAGARPGHGARLSRLAFH